MAKGGYKLIDLKDKDITISGDAVEIPGTYEAIEASYRKPVIVTGLVIGGSEMSDAWVNFHVSGGNYVGVVGKTSEGADITLAITSADMVSAT